MNNLNHQIIAPWQVMLEVQSEMARCATGLGKIRSPVKAGSYLSYQSYHGSFGPTMLSAMSFSGTNNWDHELRKACRVEKLSISEMLHRFSRCILMSRREPKMDASIS